MLRAYFRMAWRQLRVHIQFSLLNMAGLSVGMAVALLIGLWIYDEVSYDRYHDNYATIADVRQWETYDGRTLTQTAVPGPLAGALRAGYGAHFKQVVLSSMIWQHLMRSGDTLMTEGKTPAVRFKGAFMEEGGPALFGLKMVAGDRGALQDAASILVSASVAKALYGDADPMGRTVVLDNGLTLKIGGVYADLPGNTTVHDLNFVAPWVRYADLDPGVKVGMTRWDDHSFQLYVQLHEGESMDRVSAMIGDIERRLAGPGAVAKKETVFLEPMSRWHFYGQIANGRAMQGPLRYCRLFGAIGLFVLLLACINFMNLSTSRSEKRAREVGVRKAIGSGRRQLIALFYTESLLMAGLSLVVGLGLMWVGLPSFNGLAGKHLVLPVGSWWFWGGLVGFAALTGIIAGSYPALYLSSFQPVKVLKGGFRVGRLANRPREILVVLQFAISVVMIVGTIVVFKQIQYVKDRPVGYNRAGLIDMEPETDDLHAHFDLVRRDLLATGLFSEVAESSSPITGVYNTRDDVEWAGMLPGVSYVFQNIRVTGGYGKTVGWEFVAGRDFDPTMATDSSALILNEAAVKMMGLKDPIGTIVRFRKRDNRVIGVVRDMVMTNPYEPARQMMFYLSAADFGFFNYRVKPGAGMHAAIGVLGDVCRRYSPSTPFSYRFADEAFATKFAAEERVGRLAGCMAVLAIVISCLGLFGMTAWVAERRVKEIGVRKVLGASVGGLWALLSGGFIRLVAIGLVLAIPLSYWILEGWLSHYTFRTGISWWIFGVTGLGVMGVCLLTVSWEVLRAARSNPVDCLRNE